MKTCKSCGADILWARTKNGRAIPLDAVPVRNGNIVLRNGHAIVLSAVEALEFPRDPVEPMYMSHFATCPDAREHRRAA